jgi:hypothetical protein
MSTMDASTDPDTLAESRRGELEDRFTVTAEQYARMLARLDRGSPGPLCIDGREYARRQANRRKRR